MEIPASTFMPKSYDVYRNLGYWFLLLLVLVFAGFYTTKLLYLSTALRQHRVGLEEVDDGIWSL
jgi:hypothetical protein